MAERQSAVKSTHSAKTIVPADPSVSATESESLPPPVAAALAPIRAWAFGAAVGIVLAALLALVTVAHLTVLPRRAPHLDLLSQYFVGYRVAAGGALIGALWGFIVGFAAGGLIAFVRNLAVRLWIATVRARANLEESEFLDGI